MTERFSTMLWTATAWSRRRRSRYERGIVHLVLLGRDCALAFQKQYDILLTDAIVSLPDALSGKSATTDQAVHALTGAVETLGDFGDPQVHGRGRRRLLHTKQNLSRRAGSDGINSAPEKRTVIGPDVRTRARVLTRSVSLGVTMNQREKRRQRCAAMPSIYQATCSNCEHRSPMVSLHSIALRITGEDGRDTFRVLRHPGEQRELKSLGFSHKRAVREERLVGVQPAICDDCGHINTGYIADENEGCARFLVAFVVMVLFCWLALPATVPSAARFVLGGALFYGFVIINRAAVAPQRRRLASRLPVLSSCERCGGGALSTLEYNGPVVVCPECGVRAFRFACVGVS